MSEFKPGDILKIDTHQGIMVKVYQEDDRPFLGKEIVSGDVIQVLGNTNNLGVGEGDDISYLEMNRLLTSHYKKDKKKLEAKNKGHNELWFEYEDIIFNANTVKGLTKHPCGYFNDKESVEVGINLEGEERTIVFSKKKENKERDVYKERDEFVESFMSILLSGKKGIYLIDGWEWSEYIITRKEVQDE